MPGLEDRSRSKIEFSEEEQAIRLKREAVIETPKFEIILKLSRLIDNEESRQDFLILCQKLEEIIRMEFRTRQEELLNLFGWFDPISSAENLKNLHRSQIDGFEQEFLDKLSHIMEKSNFQVLTQDEWRIATSSQYLFHFTTKIDTKKLDSKIFKGRGFGVASGEDAHYIIFRRGIGIDKQSGLFLKAKLNAVLSKVWNTIAVKPWKRLRSKARSYYLDSHESSKSWLNKVETKRAAENPNEKYVCVKRIHVSNSLQLKKFFHKLDMQEPTFDHMIILYRKATAPTNAYCHGDLGIHIKHYKGIPMADMELILPAKKHPRLPLKDWIVLLVFAVISSVGILSARKQKSSLGIVVGIIVAFVSYCAKVYLTFSMNVLQYERRINKLMEDKQLDCGHGTLLYCLDEAIQQEVKEAIIAYFQLRKIGSATEEELRVCCNELIINYFQNGTSELEVRDAVEKLQRFKIVTCSEGKLHPLDMKQAKEVINEKMMEYLQSDKAEIMKDPFSFRCEYIPQ